MGKIWSENKWMDLAISVLLFLTGINFFHYGQLILPVICLLIFIDRKFRFKVSDPKVFILLCLFAVGFYAFSQPVFYSVMGFCCPMAYYIGSNVYQTDEKKIRKMIYLLAIAMGAHIILNMVYELQISNLDHLINSSSHYDFWTRDRMSSTALALDLDLLIGSLYYLLLHEKNSMIRWIGSIVFAAGIFFCLVSGRRTQVLLTAICLLVSFLFETFIEKNISGERKRRLIRTVCILLGIAAFLVACFAFDLFGITKLFNNYYIIEKLKRGLIDSERLKLFLKGISLMPYHPWGKQEISGILGLQIHDLWMDIYDYAGIVPYLLFLIYSVFSLKKIIDVLRNGSLKDRVLYLGVCLCIILQMFLEPVMTGSSLFLMVSIIVLTAIGDVK